MHIFIHKHITGKKKVVAAYENGCKRFDGALRGYGGCPMAKDDLTGNMPTENLVYYFNQVNADLKINQQALQKSMQMALEVFPQSELTD